MRKCSTPPVCHGSYVKCQVRGVKKYQNNFVTKDLPVPIFFLQTKKLLNKMYFVRGFPKKTFITKMCWYHFFVILHVFYQTYIPLAFCHFFKNFKHFFPFFRWTVFFFFSEWVCLSVCAILKPLLPKVDQFWEDLQKTNSMNFTEFTFWNIFR